MSYCVMQDYRFAGSSSAQGRADPESDDEPKSL